MTHSLSGLPGTLTWRRVTTAGAWEASLRTAGRPPVKASFRPRAAATPGASTPAWEEILAQTEAVFYTFKHLSFRAGRILGSLIISTFRISAKQKNL